MAKSTILCAECGAKIIVTGHNRSDADRKAEWMESNGSLCYNCWSKARDRARADESAKNAETAKSSGLPALTGTEKQIAWAETLRANRIKELDAFAEQIKKNIQKYRDCPDTEKIQASLSRDGFASIEDVEKTFSQAIKNIRLQTSAHWWIENRDTSTRGVLTEEIEKIQKGEKPVIHTEIPEEVAAESTARPENPITETVAEITIHGDCVQIAFHEKRDDFWETIKKKLGYTWIENHWQRRITKTSGPIEDRAAEAGNLLLRKGFVIRIYNPEILKKAIDGTYQPEIKRWVMKRTSGIYSGWFAISWDGSDEGLYQAARKLPCSRWDKPSVVVPPEQFEQVGDFAKMYGFGISEGAREILEKAREAKERGLVVAVGKPIPPSTRQPLSHPPELEVPESVEIHDDLKD